MKRALSALDLATRRFDAARRALGASRAAHRLALAGHGGDVADLARAVAVFEVEHTLARAAVRLEIEARRGMAEGET